MGSRAPIADPLVRSPLTTLEQHAAVFGELVQSLLRTGVFVVDDALANSCGSKSKSITTVASWPELSGYIPPVNTVDFDAQELLKEAVPGDFGVVKDLLANAVFDDSTMACGDFRDANLSRASFRKSSLKSADFRDTILHGAVFDEANLGKANFSEAKFDEKTSFKGGDVAGCMFFDENGEFSLLEQDRGLTANQIKAAKNWQQAHFSDEFRVALNLASEASP